MFLGTVINDNESETKVNNICTKDKIEPQHTYSTVDVIHDRNIFKGSKHLAKCSKTPATKNLDFKNLLA